MHLAPAGSLKESKALAAHAAAFLLAGFLLLLLLQAPRSNALLRGGINLSPKGLTGLWAQQPTAYSAELLRRPAHAAVPAAAASKPAAAPPPLHPQSDESTKRTAQPQKHAGQQGAAQVTVAATAAAGAARSGAPAQGKRRRPPQARPASVPATHGSAANRQQYMQAVRLPWEPLLSEEDVLRGLSYYGSGERLQGVAAKLAAGKPVKVVVLGGSTTVGAGASSAAASYPARVFRFLNATWPHRGHVFRSKALGGVSLDDLAACAQNMVPAGTDLAILEVPPENPPGVPSMAHPQRRAHEQLLRALLGLPGRPAVVQLHPYSWWRSAGDGVRGGLYYAPAAEAQLGVMAQYYNVPVVSLRTAAFPLMQARVKGFKVSKVWDRNQTSAAGATIPAAGKKERGQYFYRDVTHPSDTGHQVMAELLAALMLRAAEEQHPSKASCNTAAATGAAAGGKGAAAAAGGQRARAAAGQRGAAPSAAAAEAPVPSRARAGRGASSALAGSVWAKPRRGVPELRRLPPPMVPGTADAPASPAAACSRRAQHRAPS